jgi:hypothetical protein
MPDIHELVALIAELTSLLTATQKLADLVRAHNAHVAVIQSRLDATPTQC